MRRAVAPAILMCAACALSGRTEPSADSASLGFRHVNVVDVEGGTVLADHTVLIAGNRIRAVGPSAQVRIPPGARVVNAAGKYLIPGLWDMHVHVDDAGWWVFPLLVANGVTGVRDMGSRLEQLAEWRALAGRGAAVPRVVAAGPIVTGMVADEDPRLVRVGSRETGVRAVDSLVDAGVDLIKIHDYLLPDAYAGIMDQARRKGIHVAGHQPIAISAGEMAAAGQRSIEHTGNALGGLLVDASSEGEALRAERRALLDGTVDPPRIVGGQTPAQLLRLARGYDRVRARALAGELARHGVWLTPTLHSFGYLQAFPPDSAVLRDPRLKYLPSAVRAMLPGVLADRPGPEMSAARRELYRAQIELLQALRDGGVRFLAGTDLIPYPPQVPGFMLHDELLRLGSVGLTPAEVLRTATVNPARYLGATDSLGLVAQGRLADLVLLSANPLLDAANTQKVEAVVLNGRYLDRRRLDEMLAEAERVANAPQR